MNNFTLIAHRGLSSDAPENTFDAFDLAIEHGFPNMELDAQLTSDGEPVVIHDDDLDRTTTGKGPVAGASLAYVKSLEAGLWFEGPEDTVGKRGPAAYGDSFVPTLEEVLERYAGRTHLHLELKSHEPELASKVAELLARHGWTAPESSFADVGVTISSFDFAQLERSIAVQPHLGHAWLLPEITDDAIDGARTAGVSGLSPSATTVTPERVQLAVSSGLVVRTWGVRTLNDIDRAFDAGASGTTVDWPLRAEAHLEARATSS